MVIFGREPKLHPTMTLTCLSPSHPHLTPLLLLHPSVSVPTTSTTIATSSTTRTSQTLQSSYVSRVSLLCARVEILLFIVVSLLVREG